MTFPKKQYVKIKCLDLGLRSGCKQSCSTLQYSGKVIQEKTAKFIRLKYEFAMPMRTQIYEEYIIMDGMNMVGVIGGTFGLFIELSFPGIITNLINYFRAKMS